MRRYSNYDFRYMKPSNLMHSDESLSVHFGCGLDAPEGWLNFDVSPSLLLSKVPGLQTLLRLPPWPAAVRYGNVVRGLPVAQGSCRRLFSHNMLEHLSLADVKITLANCRKLLAADGVLRIFVPDLFCHVQIYLSLKDSGSPGAAHKLIELLDMGLAKREHGLGAMLRSLFGNSRHLWMWDESAMTDALKEAGFRSIRRVQYLDSGDPMFDRLEGLHPDYKDWELGMEARC